MLSMLGIDSLILLTAMGMKRILDWLFVKAEFQERKSSSPPNYGIQTMAMTLLSLPAKEV
jgi:hypothetical protein